ncbi:lmo0937 family membrane protein [Terriglobus tenax]|uniref:lmo0937 family membrane protein n=1 Tax=Terriglobus tenax TaxID=1111115 RepID=UPI0021E06ECB|nr:lmo0937 family membrane protein [Terriglobus tenax]
MLWTITVILVIAWLVGLVSSYTLGGWIHLLLILAVISLIFNLLAGRRSAL